MYIITQSLGQYQLEAQAYTQDFLINYSVESGSDRRYTSFDRGTQSDKYQTTLRFRGETEYIKGLVRELTLLRNDQQLIQIRDIPENIFGDHIDHSNGVDCYAFIGDEITPSFNAQEIEVTFKVDPATLTFKPVSGVPSGMDCLRHQWKGFAEWNTHINETYFGDIQYVDRVADTYVFEGSYYLNIDDTASLLNWWRTQRGTPYTLTESDWGVVDMFGAVGSSPIVEVIINNIEYEYISPTLRNVKVEILRNG